MKEISNLNPVTPSGSKPLIPLAVSAASAIIALLLIGFGAQNLIPFQQPYSLESTSEQTVEIVDAQIVLESPDTPAVSNQVGRSDVLSNNDGMERKPDTSLFAAAQEENGISDKKGQWSKTNGPEGGAVPNLFKTIDGDVLAGTQSGIYRLTDDGRRWKLLNSLNIFAHREQLSGMQSGSMVEKDGILYLATAKKILTSTDGGQTWNTLSVHQGVRLFGMAILDNTFYLCLKDEFHLSGDNGVYRSDDNGASWIRLAPFDNKYPNIEPRAITIVNNTIYVGTNKGLYRLNGNTWEQIFLDEIGEKAKYLPIISIEVKDNVFYVARSYHIDGNFRRFLGDGTPIHLTNDSWVEIQETPMQREIYNAQAATGLSWALFQSNDQGKTWDNITPRKNNTDKEKLSIINLFNVSSKNKKDSKKKDTNSSHKSSSYTPLKIAVNENKVMLVDLKKHYYSVNSGETWRTEDTKPLGNASAIVMVNEDTYYRSGNYGIYRTTDGGKSWHQFNTGLVNTDVWQLIAVDGTLYTNTICGFVYSTDQGESWNPINGDTGFITRIMESNGNLYVRDDTIGSPRFFYLSTKDNSLINISEIPILENAISRIGLGRFYFQFSDVILSERNFSKMLVSL